MALNITEFIKNCTDSWHTTKTIADELDKQGFSRLFEENVWELFAGGKYYTTRNGSSIIAFKIPDADFKSYMLASAHGESPGFKIKPISTLEDSNYIRLNTESYGGVKLDSWLDRPLSVSGRAVVENGDMLEERLVRLDRDALIIPSLAMHLDRSARDGKELNVVSDMPPLYALQTNGGSFEDELAACLGVCKEAIKGFDLMLYNREEPRIWGRNDEFISAPRLDDLQCVYALLCGFAEGENRNTVQVFCTLDNEEVGSGTKQGARSDFLSSVLARIGESFGKGHREQMQMLASSFMVSADNGHAIHPNRKEASDITNFPKIGEGVVIKYNASQKYTTDAVSEAIFKKICENADVPYQVYANRSDIAGGSTLGNILTDKVSVNAVDVGLAQLSMHSAYETAGNKDTEYMTRVITEFYNSYIKCKGRSFLLEK